MGIREKETKALNSLQPPLDCTGDKSPPSVSQGWSISGSHRRPALCSPGSQLGGGAGHRPGRVSPLLGQSEQGHVAEAEVDQVLQQLLPEVVLDGLGTERRALSGAGMAPLPTPRTEGTVGCLTHRGTVSLG